MAKIRDFISKAYSRYRDAIEKSHSPTLRFDHFFKFACHSQLYRLSRHDFDRKPQNAHKMAKLEHAVSITSTYFFRTKKHPLDAKIISGIAAALGHSIGYHYALLIDTKGHMQNAIENFVSNLQHLQNITPISNICMFGRSLSVIKQWRRISIVSALACFHPSPSFIALKNGGLI